jgi:hypothetical protein
LLFFGIAAIAILTPSITNAPREGGPIYESDPLDPYENALGIVGGQKHVEC